MNLRLMVQAATKLTTKVPASVALPFKIAEGSCTYVASDHDANAVNYFASEVEADSMEGGIRV